MATITGPCPSCGHPTEWVVGEFAASHTNLTWYRSTRCVACGSAIEEDNQGMPPRWVRQAIVEGAGLWSVVLANAADQAKAVVGLKSLLGMDLAAASKLLKRFPAIWAGTRAECVWIQGRMTDLGVQVDVVKADPADPTWDDFAPSRTDPE